MEYVLSKIKIKPGKVKETESFLKSLHNNHQDEISDILKEAQMTLDCSFVDGNHLYIFKRLSHLEILKEKIDNSELEIYKKIRKWAEECLEGVEDIKAIAAFDLLSG